MGERGEREEGIWFGLVRFGYGLVAFSREGGGGGRGGEDGFERYPFFFPLALLSHFSQSQVFFILFFIHSFFIFYKGEGGGKGGVFWRFLSFLPGLWGGGRGRLVK